MSKRSRSVTLDNGVRLPYVEQGKRSGSTMILLHGFAGTQHDFEPFLSFLPDSLRTIALTQRGHGDASHPAEGYRVQDFAADVTSFVDALQLEQFFILGHSMGSAVAQYVAADRPEQMRGLVLVSPRAAMKERPGLQKLWDERISTMTDPVDPAFVQAFIEGAFATLPPPPELILMIEDALKVPARVWKQTFGAALEEDLGSVADQISAPTLLIWGGRDQTVPESERDAVALSFPDAQHIVYESAGHEPHIEVTELMAADVVDFIRDQVSL